VLRLRHARLNARYALGLAAVAVLLWLAFRDEVMGPVLEPLRTLIAQATLELIHGVGMEATRHASAIYHPGGFAYEISRGCTGFVPAAMLAAAISGYPARRRGKVAGLALGIPALLGINLGRLVHLFYVGVHQPEWFDVAHKVAWEGLIILAVVGFWLGWATWVDRGVRTPASGSTERSSPSSAARAAARSRAVQSRSRRGSCGGTRPYW
jgi:exosortase/archaeosortase family protein